jgi:hypothetical protein
MCVITRSGSPSSRQHGELGGRDDEVVRVRSFVIALPTQQLNHARAEGIGRGLVDLVMQAIHHHVVLLNEGSLLLIDRVIGEEGGVVAVIVKRRLMRDHQVQPTAVRFLEHVHGVEKGGRDAGHWGRGIAGLEGIDGVRYRVRVALLNTMEGFTGGECLGDCGEREQGETQDNIHDAHVCIMHRGHGPRQGGLVC